MAETIKGASWAAIESLRERLAASLVTFDTLAGASQSFVDQLVATFPTIELARVFVVAPFGTLPPTERDVAENMSRRLRLAHSPAPELPILALLGSAGTEASWNSRDKSQGHRALPLDGAFVEQAPMIASLLASLDVDLGQFRSGSAVQLRAMTGGLNSRFFVPDARTAQDGEGRNIIASQEFVAKHGIRTVFGMGGGFVDRTLTVIIVFTRELLDAIHIDRFASFISTFKMATSTVVSHRAIFTAIPRT